MTINKQMMTVSKLAGKQQRSMSSKARYYGGQATLLCGQVRQSFLSLSVWTPHSLHSWGASADLFLNAAGLPAMAFMP
jgi:hypothetical protein